MQRPRPGTTLALGIQVGDHLGMKTEGWMREDFGGKRDRLVMGGGNWGRGRSWGCRTEAVKRGCSRSKDHLV